MSLRRAGTKTRGLVSVELIQDHNVLLTMESEFRIQVTPEQPTIIKLQVGDRQTTDLDLLISMKLAPISKGIRPKTRETNYFEEKLSSAPSIQTKSLW